jgi:hypothetical protein
MPKRGQCTVIKLFFFFENKKEAKIRRKTKQEFILAL